MSSPPDACQCTAMKVSWRSILYCLVLSLHLGAVGSFAFRSLARKNEVLPTFRYFNTIARKPSAHPNNLWGTKSASEGLPQSVVQKLSLSQQFERWTFLQDLLEGDVEASDANQLLYLVLTAYSSTSVAVLREKSYPLLDDDNRATIHALAGKANDNAIAILQGTDMVCEAAENSAAMIADLETLLPDPVDDEDAFKSNWDTIMEIHGREGVRINQKKESRDWEARCMVARVLIWLEFLGAGVLKEKECERLS